jgi:hypothetical protein
MATDDQKIDLNVQAEFIRQEHRLFHILRNSWEFRKANDDDPRKEASKSAILWRIVLALMPTTVVGGIGILGIFLALQANFLLSIQNDKIERQNHLSEATRRAALIYELTSILDKIDFEIREMRKENPPQEEGLSGSLDNLLASLMDSSAVENWELSNGLEGRIIALSRSLRPYYYYDYDKEELEANQSIFFFGKMFKDYPMIERPLSPERAQLLISLLASKVNIRSIVSTGDFKNSDLQNADLGSYDLKFIDLSSSSLQNTSFIGTDLEFSILENCILNGARFDEANLRNMHVDENFLEQFPELTQNWSMVKDTLDNRLFWKIVEK